MYLEYFQLKSQPFSEHAAAAVLWQDRRMEEGLTRLEYLIQCGQLGVVTGQSGVGKSALLKRFLHGLQPQHCQALYCHFSQLPSAGLLKLIVAQLGETPRRGKERICEQILERATRCDGALLLVPDEAHLLTSETLTDLRLLISSALDSRPPLKILLVGQEPLRDPAEPNTPTWSTAFPSGTSFARSVGNRRAGTSTSSSVRPRGIPSCSTTP